MIVLLGILLVAWLVSSNIKWMMIAAAAMMLMIGSCGRRLDESVNNGEYDQVYQYERHVAEPQVVLSPSGLPVEQQLIFAAPPGYLANDTGW